MSRRRRRIGKKKTSRRNEKAKHQAETSAFCAVNESPDNCLRDCKLTCATSKLGGSEQKTLQMLSEPSKTNAHIVLLIHKSAFIRKSLALAQDLANP